MTVYDLLRPILFSLGPELAHSLTLKGLSLGSRLLPSSNQDDSRLAVEALGLNFSNPLGMAAGFDKNGEVPDALLKLGFGFTEIGTVTPEPQIGNPKPRVFRLIKDQALINRLGFNNNGQRRLVDRLEQKSEATRKLGVLGVNIGANKESLDRILDYGAGAKALSPYADYLVVNVSSPNTPNLRGLQSAEALSAIINQVRSSMATEVPVLVKIAPDLSKNEIEEIAEISRITSVNGIIVSNTTIERPKNIQDQHKNEEGGLSGNPLFEPSTRVLSQLYQLTKGQTTLIGVGGVGSAEDALKKIRSGASLVQLYTALVYKGPGLIKKIKHDLVELLERDGLQNISNAIGIDV